MNAGPESRLPEIVQMLLAEPDAQRLTRAFLEAAAWLATTGSDLHPLERAAVGTELINLARLDREIRELRGATETRWDGRSSAFQQADTLAHEDRAEWFASLNRLADLMDRVRSADRAVR